jgi:hypothetical protein
MVITDASTKLTEIEIKKVGAQSEPDVQEAADVEAVRLPKRKVREPKVLESIEESKKDETTVIKVRGRSKASSKKN